MRKRNHVIPVRLNAKELRFLEEQVEKKRPVPVRNTSVPLSWVAKSGQDPVSIIRSFCGKYPVCATTPISLPM